ncbi:MAG TPA: hypothetical protein VFN67_02195 [Polyangiales bacterium]|nr:hypothetical protein [Polyangiales bacterium]
MSRAPSEAHRPGDRSREPRSSIDVTLPIERQPAYLRLADVAALLGKCVRTISSWEQRGLLRVTRPAGGSPLVARSEVERLLSEGTSVQAGDRPA